MTVSAQKLDFCLEYIHNRLSLWAEYIAAEGSTLNSVPAYMKLTRSEPCSTVLLPCTFDEFNEINQVIAQLDEPLRQVVVLEWTANGTQENKARQVRPPRKGITTRTYRDRLKHAYCALMRLGL